MNNTKVILASIIILSFIYPLLKVLAKKLKELLSDISYKIETNWKEWTFDRIFYYITFLTLGFLFNNPKILLTIIILGIMYHFFLNELKNAKKDKKNILGALLLSILCGVWLYFAVIGLFNIR